ncbi:MAG: hypothetical protein PHP08_02185 [Candidatus Dojkabacteria bacterium]|nr:hypothetical protein [Candidatus Dojkabacteria bacterium]
MSKNRFTPGELILSSKPIKERTENDKRSNREIVKGLLEKYPYGLRKIQLENSTLAIFDCKLLYDHYEKVKGAYALYQEQIDSFKDTTYEEMFMKNNGRTCFVFSEDGLTTIKRQDINDKFYLNLNDDEIKDIMVQIQDEINSRGSYFAPTDVEIGGYVTRTYNKGVFDNDLNPGFVNTTLGNMLRAINILTKEESEETKPVRIINDIVKDVPEEEIRIMLEKI